MTEPLCISIREACDVLDVGEDWIYARIDDGTLASTKIGRRRFLNRAQVLAIAGQLAAKRDRDVA